MEPIGGEIHQVFKREETKDELVSKFNVLQFLVTPPDHGVMAEVALFNDAGECIGPARWVQLNPDSEGVDHWKTIVNMTLKQINTKVKTVLQELDNDI